MFMDFNDFLAIAVYNGDDKSFSIEYILMYSH